MLKKRIVGRQGLEVSALGLGCMGMSVSYGEADERESIATIHRAIELGVDLRGSRRRRRPRGADMDSGRVRDACLR